MKKSPYKHFSNYVLRTPLLSIDTFKNLTEHSTISDKKLKELFSNSIVQEAVFLASPELFTELNKWHLNKITDEKKIVRLKVSFLKYISRMTSRCTPFGIFAGCSLGEFSKDTRIVVNDVRLNKKHTRLDMNYLVGLAQDLSKIPRIRRQLLFFPNSSLYEIGNEFRYVEYSYEGAKRLHHIVAVDSSNFIRTILKNAKKGMLLNDLASVLINDEITLNEGIEFVNELIDNQVLVSNLEPSVVGPEFLSQIKGILKPLTDIDDIKKILNKVDIYINNLDKKMGNDSSAYKEICDILKSLKTSFNIKYLFQTDMNVDTVENVISYDLINQISKGISLLNKLSLPPTNTPLKEFTDAFFDRFETREIPLSKALDLETGIGYKQNQGTGDINPLVDDLINLRSGKKSNNQYTITKIDSIFQKKILDAILNNEHTIYLKDEDFNGLTNRWDDLPDTISVMVEMIKIDGVEKVRMKSASGSSAANLLGRFCHSNSEISKYVEQIISKEEELIGNKILAEIVHLPEARVGNILMRPAFRKYDIPYLAKSVLSKKEQLDMDDLHLSMENKTKKIKLFSKKTNKVVIPRLTNAHNFRSGSLPVYQFLSDMQTQGLRSGVFFNLGSFEKEYSFIPRIEYQNLILREASWRFNKSDISSLTEIAQDDTKLLTAINEIRKNRNVPKLVRFSQGDNELLINLENIDCIKMLLNIVKKLEDFSVKEFLFSNDSVVKSIGTSEIYSNQVIFSFYNSKKSVNEQN